VILTKAARHAESNRHLLKTVANITNTGESDVS